MTQIKCAKNAEEKFVKSITFPGIILIKYSIHLDRHFETLTPRVNDFDPRVHKYASLAKLNALIFNMP